MTSSSNRTRARILTIAIMAAFAAPAAAQVYVPGEFIKAQAPHKGRQGPGGPGPGVDRGDRRGPPPDRREAAPPDRRGQMSDDERRALNQDLDKANRELYRRRFPQ